MGIVPDLSCRIMVSRVLWHFLGLAVATRCFDLLLSCWTGPLTQFCGCELVPPWSDSPLCAQAPR